MRLAQYAVRRLRVLPVALFTVVTLAFLVVSVLPGNPAARIAGPAASDEQIRSIETRLGLDMPLTVRYGRYVSDLATGDLGESFYSNRPVLSEIRRFLPSTLELVIPALFLAAVIGITLASVGAYYAGRSVDRASRLIVTAAQSLPDFFLGLVLIYVFFFLLDWAPAPVGRLGFTEVRPEQVTGFLLIDTLLQGEWGLFWSAVKHSILPVGALGFYFSSFFARTARASLGPAMRSQQVEFARACGLSEWQVFTYAFRQARTPMLTYGGILLAALLGGAAIIERVFAWGGLGEWAIDAILQLDIPAVQGFVLVAGIGTLVIFVLLDLTVAALDPRVSYD